MSESFCNFLVDFLRNLIKIVKLRYRKGDEEKKITKKKDAEACLNKSNFLECRFVCVADKKQNVDRTKAEWRRAFQIILFHSAICGVLSAQYFSKKYSVRQRN